MSLAQKQWNVAAVLAVIAVLSVNGVGAVGLFTNHFTLQDMMNFVMPIDALVLGWFGRMLTTKEQ